MLPLSVLYLFSHIFVLFAALAFVLGEKDKELPHKKNLFSFPNKETRGTLNSIAAVSLLFECLGKKRPREWGRRKEEEEEPLRVNFPQKGEVRRKVHRIRRRRRMRVSLWGCGDKNRSQLAGQDREDREGREVALPHLRQRERGDRNNRAIRNFFASVERFFVLSSCHASFHIICLTALRSLRTQARSFLLFAFHFESLLLPMAESTFPSSSCRCLVVPFQLQNYHLVSSCPMILFAEGKRKKKDLIHFSP